jgi:hypothetical protein
MMVTSRFRHAERSGARSKNLVADLETRFTRLSRDVPASLDMT